MKRDLCVDTREDVSIVWPMVVIVCASP